MSKPKPAAAKVIALGGQPEIGVRRNGRSGFVHSVTIHNYRPGKSADGTLRAIAPGDQLRQSLINEMEVQRF